MKVVADASAWAAIVFGEKEASWLVERLEGEAVFAPELLRFELANVALKKARRQPDRAAEIFGRLEEFFDGREVRWLDVHPTDVAILAKVTGLSAYDASYLWLAGWLEADLVTLDKRLSAVIGPDSEATD